MGSYDIIYGEQRGKPTAMDFTSQLQDLCLALGACTHVYCLVFTAVAEACALLLLNAGPRGTGADGP